MLINDHELDIDIEEELEPYYDEFKGYRLRGNKLQSCSPFRSEEHPSFAVNLDTGVFIDSGSANEDWRKGNFTKLLSFLQGVTYEEAEEYLLVKYRTILDDVDSFTLDIRLEQPKVPRVLSAEEVEPYLFRHSYLSKRGITEKVQKAFRIGYDSKGDAVVFIWHDKEGNPINLKFRSVTDKRFWYMAGGQPIKQHIYGLHFFYKMQLTTAVVTESETDALYLWSLGIPAIALGSASLSKRQEELLLMSPIDTLILAFDRDNAGNVARTNVSERLLGKLKLQGLPIARNCKDVNDMSPYQITGAMSNVSEISIEIKGINNNS